MRHLFFVHSFATLHCALGAIKRLELKCGDCVFIPARDFQFPDLPKGAKTAVLTFRKKLNMGSWRNLLKAPKAIKLADLEIATAAQNSPFHAYIPHSYYQPIQLVISHQLCRGYSYIEEGVTSYFGIKEIDKAYPPNDFGRRARIFTKTFYRKRFPARYTFFHEGYHAAYGFSDDSFPRWERRVTLGAPEYLKYEGPLIQGAPPVLVFDALVERGLLSSSALAKGLRDYLSWMSSRNVVKLRYKLHPGQRMEDSIKVIKDVLNSPDTGLETIELPRDLSLEELFAREDCEVHVFNSAAGIYARIAGRTVYTINSFIAPYDEKYLESVKLLPVIYRPIIDPAESSHLRINH
jgi:hypothetical protein